MSDFQKALEQLINQHSQENGSNTPDFILAKYLAGCLENFNAIVTERERWHGRALKELIVESVDVNNAVVECNSALPDRSNVKASSYEDSDYTSSAKTELEVIEAMKADSNYPLGEVDANKWAIAWRLTRDRNKIDANGSQAVHDIDGWMTSWFANCMASAHPDMIIQRGDDEYAKSIC